MYVSRAWIRLVASALMILGLAATAAPAAEKASVHLHEGGVIIEAATMGKFTLEFPLPAAGEKTYKLVEKAVAGNKATLKYEGGGQIEMTLAPDGTLAMALASMPADAKSLRMEMLIDFNLSQGGTWKIADGPETPFPAQKPAKPFLFQGNADRLVLKDIEGRTIDLQIPQYSFQQLQDNREWNWKTFQWMFLVPLEAHAGGCTMKITLTAPAAGAKKVLVDRFGQSTLSDYAGKVKSVEELKTDMETERQWIASLRPPKLDRFGGLPGSGEKLGLRKTGFFHVERKAGKWFLVNPEGNAFFQLGVCSFQPAEDYTWIGGRQHSYEWLPAAQGEFASAFRLGDPSAFSFYLANRIRKFGKPYELNDFLAGMIERVRPWGFNSGGAFSPTFEPAQRKANWPYVGHLPLHFWEGMPKLAGQNEIWDPFEPANRQRVDKLLAEKIAPHANDPLLIGYFLANEPLYEKLYGLIPSLDGQFACKKRFVQFLKDKHRAIDAYNKAWSAEAKSFDELTDRGLAVTTDVARQEVRDFVGLFFEEYYRLVTETFRKYDKNHLLLGSRFQPGTINNQQLCRICGKYMDVVSFNYYTHALDKDLLKRIYAWSGEKPMLLSEFYFASPSDSGLPSGVIEVASQLERGLAYRNYVEQAASLGFVVGIEWFTLVDQATTGRWFEKYNAENANTGLVNVADRPWKTMLEPMMKTNYEVYDVLLGARPPFAFDHPKFQKK